MGTKLRIYQVAKEFELSNDALIQFLRDRYDIRNHMSPVTDEMYVEIKRKFGSEGVPVNNEKDFRRRLKEKVAQEAAKQVEARKELQERLKTATQFVADRSSIHLKATSTSDEHESVEEYIKKEKAVALQTEAAHAAQDSRTPGSEKEQFGPAGEVEVSASDGLTATPAQREPKGHDASTRRQSVDQSRPEGKATAETEATLEAPEITAALASDRKVAKKDVVTPEIPADKIHAPERLEKSPATAETLPSTKVTSFEKGKIERPSAFPTERKSKPGVPETPAVVARAPRPAGQPGSVPSGKQPPATPGKPGSAGAVTEAELEKKKKKRRRRRKKKIERPPELTETVDGVVTGPDQEPEPEVELEYDAVMRREKAKKKVPKKLREGEVALEAKDRNRDLIRKKKKKRKKVQISDAEIDESIKATLAIMSETVHGRKKRKRVREKEDLVEDETEENVIRVNEFISVAELAQAMETETNEVIKKCLEMGMMVSINQRLDKDVLETVADEFGFRVEILPEYGHDKLEEIDLEEEQQGVQNHRPAVVTIMGHVDHGKTSLLDYIRQSNIIAGEAGGITQHIGAYAVNVNGQAITFLDTPGHEAFTAMRARGAQITDIVVLIVAADDAVMPQTIEAINHAQAARVQIIVAINKIDKPNANIELIKKQLAEHNVLIEEWGGRYQCVEISAKTGQGIPRLLELILLEAEVLELTANYDKLARGVIVESRLDKGKGVVATVLIQQGTLRVGEPFIVGQYFGKVRSLYDERNQRVEYVTPSEPVQIVGFSGLPAAGDTFVVLKSEKDTREISLKRQQLRREHELRQIKHLTLDEISRQVKHGGVKELLLIVKGDVDGSVEALSEALMKLSNEEVRVNVIHKGVGAISESDVLLAVASNAIIIGFQVRPTLKARDIAKREKVDVRLYRVIYDAIAEVKSALEGLLEPDIEEEVRGTIEVRQIFRVPKVGVVAGCYVLSGRIGRNDKVKLYRDDKLIYDGRVDSLRRFKEDTKEVTAGFECGLSLTDFDDLKIQDIIESYRTIQVKRTLTPA